jgi:phage tail sheath protein FI
MALSIGIQFNTSSLIPADAPSNSVIGIVGTAAIGQLDTPIAIRNQQEAIAKFGYATTGTTIPDALLRAYSTYGQIPLVVVNVGVGTPLAVTPADYSFDSQDRIFVPHRHITLPVVTNQAGTTTYVLDTDYTVDLAKGFFQRKGSTIPINTIVKVSYSRPDFSGILPAAIVGGVNGTTGKREGLEALIDAELVDLKPSNITDIICPNYSQIAAVASKMGTIAAKLRAQYYLDAPASATLAEVLAGRTAAAAPVAHFATRDENAILCFPNPMVSGKEEWFSQHVAFARAIASPELAPTNLELKGITGWKTTLLTSALITTTDKADNQKLIEVGVVTYRNRSGLNPVIWGHFNASFPQELEALKNFDRIPVVRIRNMCLDVVQETLAGLVGQPLNDTTIAAAESMGNMAMSTVPGVRSSQLTWLREESDLPANKLAFRILISIAGIVDIIVANFVFNASGI